MTTPLTRRGVTLLAGAVLVWLVGRVLGVPELYIVSTATAALVGAGALAVTLNSASISVRRTLSRVRLGSGGDAEVTLELRNDARFPAGTLLVSDACPFALRGDRADGDPRFVVAGLASGQTVSLGYAVHGGARGRWTVGPVRIRVRDPFGTTERVRRYRASEDVIVYPRVEPLGPQTASGAHRGTGSGADRRLLNTGDEFYTMREYQTGDDLRQVHWASTARRQKLMVRQNEMPWQAQATVLLDTRREAHSGVGPTSTLERAVSSAASILTHLAAHSYRTRLATETTLHQGRVEPLQAHMDRLAVLEPSHHQPLGPALQQVRRGAEGGLLVAVVPPPPGGHHIAGQQEIRDLIAAGRSFSTKMALIIDTARAGPSTRAAETAEGLRAAGWRATVLWPHRPLEDAWRTLQTAPARAALRSSR